MNNNNEILNAINEELSQKIADYKGMYFFGSRLNNPEFAASQNSDFDVVLIFDSLNYQKQLKIAGLVSDIEYTFDVFIDCKLFTSEGYKSIEYIRREMNPIFIQNAIDKGVYYARV